MSDDESTENENNVVPLRLISGTPAELIETPALSLANVKGLARSKSILRNVVDDLTRTNREPPLSGILLYGPPNCGKTYLCRVLAGELHSSFLPIAGQELADAGENGARIVRDAKRIAERSMPCVLLFDEIDMLHHEESTITENHRLATVQAIAEVLDQAANETENLFVVAATATNPWHVPSELVRVGRLGQILLVLPPDRPARDAMLHQLLRDLALDADVDIDWIAEHTDGYNGVDLQHLVENARQIATDNGRNQPNMSDMKSAFHHLRPNAAAWLDRAAHQAMLSKHTGLYDDLIDYLEARHRP